MTQSPFDTRTTLSPEGSRRKEAIREAACKATADRRRGAWFLTTVAFSAVPVVLAVAIWSQLPTGAELVPEGGDALTKGNADVDSAAGIARVIEIVQDDGTPVYSNLRYVTIVDRPPVAVHTINDDELLDLLAKAGRPSGLIRIGETVMVVEHTKMAGHDEVVPGAS